jgi:hypothetical protein
LKVDAGAVWAVGGVGGVEGVVGGNDLRPWSARAKPLPKSSVVDTPDDRGEEADGEDAQGEVRVHGD